MRCTTRSWRVPAVATTLLALLMLLGPATAEARAGGQDRVSFEFHGSGPATHGYKFDLYAAGPRNLGISITSELRSGHRTAFATTFYDSSRPSRVSRRRIRGRLGSRGRVGLRFVAKERRVRRLLPGSSCKARIIIRTGVLRGHLRFRGEGRYTSVKVKRLRARRRTLDFANCRPTPAERPAPTVLGACTDQGATVVAFSDRRAGRIVYGSPPPAARDGLWIFGFAAVQAGRSAFSYNKDLSRAKLDPGVPFRGQASYSDGLLEGSLRVRAPGLATAPLTPAPAGLATDPDDLDLCAGILSTRAADDGSGARVEVRPPPSGAVGDAPTFAMRCERGRGCRPRPGTLP